MSRTRFPLVAVAAIVAAVAAVLVATSGASTKKTSAPVAAGAAISLKQTALGQTLVDGAGRTLYLFAGDKPNVSTLSAAGQAVWPPFTSNAKPQALNRVVASRIGAVTHTSGTPQITYNGHPLYYYVADTSPGQTNGQGLNQFGALWYALGSNGDAVTAASNSTPAPATSNGAPA
jgi:predicted lipoprotein with Yx(FWY)xxD motif